MYSLSTRQTRSRGGANSRAPRSTGHCAKARMCMAEASIAKLLLAAAQRDRQAFRALAAIPEMSNAPGTPRPHPAPAATRIFHRRDPRVPESLQGGRHRSTQFRRGLERIAERIAVEPAAQRTARQLGPGLYVGAAAVEDSAAHHARRLRHLIAPPRYACAAPHPGHGCACAPATCPGRNAARAFSDSVTWRDVPRAWCIAEPGPNAKPDRIGSRAGPGPAAHHTHRLGT
jgi:hypothetical protein